MSNKFEDLINAAKVSELLHKKELEEKNKNAIVIVLAVLGAIAAVAGIAFAVYYLILIYILDLGKYYNYKNTEVDIPFRYFNNYLTL